MKYYLTAFTMFQNERRYLKEWLDFHLLVGVEHFYMYSDRSEDNPLEVLQPYIDRGLVTYVEWVEGIKKLYSWRDHFLKNYGHETFWAMFTDVDEFLFCSNAADDLKTRLREYEGFSGIGVNSLGFGDSGIKQYDRRPVLERFTLRTPDNHEENTHIKTIAQTRHMSGSKNAHFVDYRTGFSVNEHKEKIVGAKCVNKNNIFRINHYFMKSEEEYYKFKFKPNEGRGPQPKAVYDKYNSECTVEDRLIQRYLEALKKC